MLCMLDASSLGGLPVWSQNAMFCGAPHHQLSFFAPQSKTMTSTSRVEQLTCAACAINDAIAAVGTNIGLPTLVDCRRLVVPLHELYRFYSSSAGSLQLRSFRNVREGSSDAVPLALLKALAAAMSRYACVIRMIAAHDGTDAKAKHTTTLAGVLVGVAKLRFYSEAASDAVDCTEAGESSDWVHNVVGSVRAAVIAICIDASADGTMWPLPKEISDRPDATVSLPRIARACQQFAAR